MGFLKIIAGVGAYLIYRHFSNKSETAKKLDTVTRVFIEPVKLKDRAIKLRIEVMVKNPTENALSFRQPYVRLFFKNKPIGSSQLSDKVKTIAAYHPLPVDPIFLTIPATGLLTLGDGLLKAILQKQPVQIKTLTTISVDIGGGIFRSFTIEDTIDIPVK